MSYKTVGDLDRIDLQILETLQANGRLTMAELAEKVSLSQSPCWRRVQQLEQAGFIEGYHARLSRKLLGLGVHGFVNLRMKDHSPATAAAFERQIVALAGAISCQNLSGGYDYQIELVAADHEAFAKLVREIRSVAGVSEVYTSFTLHEIKSGGALPIG
ncbi:Lrp/AsnC family transcriptional regulator [Leeia sp. TBRC 13508]|uniref:Lrp/AsnC family transcriptional regulator n=1 Tax=Leeia speluncae TaxID=2884804 RepID=A0ABS8DAC1_9NEIS|nr:Lrp/AsnC family transcriptional regulator [Leeia speluncae]MCB6185155.1 Lrp/AsnC family transcriptional regulator [Leeia speluncae]